jgi:heat-inducible transcriptional repressor
MITDRQKKILQVIINEYIDSAQPVSSSLLTDKYDFGLCSASFRIEMKNLTDKGYLEKTHISSGRVPTDKAYRFFVNELIDDSDYDQLKINRNDDYLKTAEEILDLISGMSSSYVILSFPERKIFFQAGFNNLIKEPESMNKDFLFSFLSFIEEYNKAQEKIEMDSSIKIYIGNENPFLKQEDLSLICSEKRLKNNENMRVSLMGPKRMNYYNNIRLINSLIKTLEEL